MAKKNYYAIKIGYTPNYSYCIKNLILPTKKQACKLYREEK